MKWYRWIANVIGLIVSFPLIVVRAMVESSEEEW